MSNLPKGWELVQFDKVCDIRDGTHDSPKYIENGIPFITSKHLTDNGIDFTETNYISEENHIEFSKRSKVDNGDILFGMIGTIGKPVIVNTDFEFSIKNIALLKLSSNELLSNIYVLNLLKSNIIINQFSKLSNGGVQSFIALGMIRKLKIPLPPLEEQKKIADILSTVDKKIAFVEENINETEELKKGLMQKLLTEGIGHTEFKDSELGRIPESWEVDIIENLATVVTGSKDTQNKVDNGNYPFFVRSDTVERINTYSFEGEAVLTSGDGVGVGKIFHYVNCKFDYHQRVYNIHNFKSNILGKYFYEFFKANFYSRVSRLSAKNSVDSVRREMITKMNILVPPLEEQKQIAEILSTIDNKLENLKEKKQSFEELKKGLMQKLLTGEVRV